MFKKKMSILEQYRAQRPPTRIEESRRGNQIRRVIALMIFLSKKPATYRELVDQFHVSKKTIARDIRVIERVGVPVYEEFDYDANAVNEKSAGYPVAFWRVDRHWARHVLEMGSSDIRK